MASTSSTKLNPEKVREMRRLRAEGYTYPALSRLFGVSENTVARTCRGNAWMKVTQGVEVLTDAAAELRNLDNPLFQQQPSMAAVGPSPELIKLQAEIDARNAQEGANMESSIPEQYRRIDDPEEYRRTIQQMVEEGQRRTANNGPPPAPVPVRYSVPSNDGKPGAINAQELLETLKDEQATKSTSERGAENNDEAAERRE